MSRQGKLHSSPFHVEDARYIYAIEHEVTLPKDLASVCPYLKQPSNLCTLWNSGYERCSQKQCIYFKFASSSGHSGRSCENCAYVHNSHCHHKNNKSQKHGMYDAEYCIYYLSVETDLAEYKRIHIAIISQLYDNAISKVQKKIKSQRRHIAKAEKQLSTPDCTTSDRLYYEDTIVTKTAGIDKCNADIEKYCQEKELAIAEIQNL